MKGVFMQNNGIWRIIATIFISSLLSINAFFLSSLKNDINNIDTKIFTHLTNHEIHISRENVTTKAEFEMHCNFAEQGKIAVLEAIKSLEKKLERKR